MGQVAGYRAADYLLQHAYEVRRCTTLPAAVWQALANHIHDHGDLRRLASNAHTRFRPTFTKQFLSPLVAAGDEAAIQTLATISATSDPDAAVTLLAQLEGDSAVDGQRIWLLYLRQDAEGLRAAAQQGDIVAACQLVQLWADTDIAAVHTAAAEGNQLAGAWLVGFAADDEYLQSLRYRADNGDRIARGRLADLLAERGRVDDAIQLLTAPAEAKDRLADDHLADLLYRYDLTPQLVRRAMSGSHAADDIMENPGFRGVHTALRIAGTLADNGHADRAIAVMQAYVDASTEAADCYLHELLVVCDRIDLLRERADTGEWGASRRLAEVYAEATDVKGLYDLEQQENWFATLKIVDWMLSDGREQAAIEHLRTQTARRNEFACFRLLDMLIETGNEEEVYNRALSDPVDATGSWAYYLASTGNVNQAIEWLENHSEPEDLTVSRIADILIADGRADEAIARLRKQATGYGDGATPNLLIDTLFNLRRKQDLRDEVNAGVTGAMDKLILLLIHDQELSKEDADAIRANGVTAEWPTERTGP